ncbi:hypothetical protein EV644_104129 [Kribbella orskensis]|uniref:Uncharacterized protein n=1 Tax=Kribbella orskensis TaxID=2512216 RepID=A0ABY2BQ15_9ACTN|nr:hypothetical protein EV642_103129 [Kribbella sp. VKM Ac-2500]TCO25625.1 hypothetical protein EV644_104129 [Kribbella orskensis]
MATFSDIELMTTSREPQDGDVKPRFAYIRPIRQASGVPHLKSTES